MRLGCLWRLGQLSLQDFGLLTEQVGSRTAPKGPLLTSWLSDSSRTHLLCGATQLIQAQDHVNRQAELHDPSEGLSGCGIHALSFLRSEPTDVNPPVLVKTGIPSSSLAVSQTGKKRSTGARLPGLQQSKPDSPKQSRNEVKEAQLPPDSLLKKTSIVGTTSSKLSYLLSRIEEFYRDEKILVFYDNDNTAFYIAQALEVLHIDFLIYAKSLTPAIKSDYVVRFNQKHEHRVLLIDIGQAAFGLNFPSASRVFFINPVNRPQVEAQALKRAHRIGQTREVHAETLILKGTIEEKIFERARNMSRVEHKNAKELDDDGAIREIIQSAQPIPISRHEAGGAGSIAFIQRPQQLFARPGWARWKKAARENSKPRTETAKSSRSQKRKAESSNEEASNRKRSKKRA
jgi:superfamily II DNA/RNA helicase